MTSLCCRVLCLFPQLFLLDYRCNFSVSSHSINRISFDLFAIFRFDSNSDNVRTPFLGNVFNGIFVCLYDRNQRDNLTRAHFECCLNGLSNVEEIKLSSLPNLAQYLWPQVGV